MYKTLHKDVIIYTYVEEDSVVVGISIVPINAIKPLRKLDVADPPAHKGVHQEAHGLPKRLAVVDVVITI